MEVDVAAVERVGEEPVRPGPGLDALEGAMDVARYSASKIEAEVKMAQCEAVIDIVSAYFNVSSKDLRSPSRSAAPVARVRQVGMYVAHTTLQLTMQDVGAGFARDRTTVKHAVHVIEDLREDIEFDAIIAIIERLVGVLVRRFGQ